MSVPQHWSKPHSPCPRLWAARICCTFCLLDFLIPQQIFVRQRLFSAFFTMSVFDCLLLYLFTSSSTTTHSSNSLFIPFILTLIFPSLLCPILIWLSRLLRAPLFLSPTSSPAIAIPILNFLDKQSSITKGHNWSTFSKENISFFWRFYSEKWSLKNVT